MQANRKLPQMTTTEGTPLRQVSISLPSSDYRLISTLSHKMGWKLHTPRKSGIEKALDDVRAGRVYEASSVSDLIAQLES